MRKVAMWLIHNVPLGFLAPHIFAFAIGCKKYRKIARAGGNGVGGLQTATNRSSPQ